MEKFVTATEALRAFRAESESRFHKLHFWESMRDLEKRLKGQIEFRFDFDNFEWSTVVICGSRAWGIEYPRSDLNAYFFYRGDLSLREVIDGLEERPLYHDRVIVNVVPVRVFGKGQQIIDTLEKELSYLEKKEIAVMAERDLHTYYVDALQRLLSRPRNLLAAEMFKDIISGDIETLKKALEHVGGNADALDGLAAGNNVVTGVFERKAA